MFNYNYHPEVVKSVTDGLIFFSIKLKLKFLVL